MFARRQLSSSDLVGVPLSRRQHYHNNSDAAAGEAQFGEVNINGVNRKLASCSEMRLLAPAAQQGGPELRML